MKISLLRRPSKSVTFPRFVQLKESTVLCMMYYTIGRFCRVQICAKGEKQLRLIFVCLAVSDLPPDI